MMAVGGKDAGYLHPGEVVSFGPFRLFPGQRRIERHGEDFPLGSRALDILIALIEHAGEVIDKRALIAHAWRNIVVDESNLRVNIAGLRKALGEGEDGIRYVTNIPGRGYCFVARVTRETLPQEGWRMTLAAPRAARPETGLPPVLARMVGRSEAVRSLSAAVVGRRFVSVVGPGGIGKTTVAVAVAHALAQTFSGAVHFLDLGAVTCAERVVQALARALGVTSPDGDPLANILECLRKSRALIVFDNCEHVIAAVAALAERLTGEAAGGHILATSREALRVEGEHVHHLAPLETPPRGVALTVAEARAFSAVELFMERAVASGSRIELSARDVSIVAAICGRLDGIALAIELAAGRVGAFGIQGTASLLDNRFRLQWQGRRTALARHQTLGALLDWSHNLLPEPERRVFRRLAVFTGTFSLGSVLAVVPDEMLDRTQTIEAVDSLVAKSLLMALPTQGGSTRYRLLETTRVYAMEKLADAGEAGMTGADVTGVMSEPGDAMRPGLPNASARHG